MNRENLTPDSALNHVLETLAQPGASRTEVDQSADRLLRLLEREYERMPEPRRPAWRSVARPFPLGWTAAIVAMLLAGALIVLQVGKGPIATVETGTLAALDAAVAGGAFQPDQSYRVGDTGATLSLADDSRIELSAQSTFSISRKPDGLELGLARGNVLVTAAKQKAGRLSVRTPGLTVFVQGTVFAVTAEEMGARVSVYEGQVEVVERERSYKVGAGDQVSTSAALRASTLQAEIGWSRNPGAVLALLQAPEVAPVLPGAEGIEGILTNLTTGEPLANAAIRVTEGNPARTVTEVKTGADGRFRVGKILPGAYQVAPFLDGFWASDPPGAGVTIGPGEFVRNLRLLMVGSATVSGRVTDENGQPVPSRRLSLDRFQQGGPFNLGYDHDARGGRTNQRGEYEFTGVRPGKVYIKGIVPHRVSIYHPGTANVDDAVAVDLRPGTVTTGIDLTLPAVVSHSIRFTAPKSGLAWFDAVYERVTTPRSAFMWRNARTPRLRPPETPTVLEITLRPSTRVFDQESVIQNVVALKDDEYLIPNVPPGRYRLHLSWKGEHENFPAVPVVVPRAELEVDVEVIDRNVDLGRLASKPRDLSIPVRFTFENGSESDVTLRAISVEARNEVNSKSRPLRLDHLAKGTYGVSVSGLPPDRYVSRMSYSGQDVLSNGLVLNGADSGTLEVVIDGPGGSVEGMVRGVKGEAVPNARVVLVSGPRWVGSRSVITDKDGMFRFANLRPGDYRLYSWEFALPGTYNDPEWRREYETRGTPVSVGKGETVYADVRRIPATS